MPGVWSSSVIPSRRKSTRWRTRSTRLWGPWARRSSSSSALTSGPPTIPARSASWPQTSTPGPWIRSSSSAAIRPMTPRRTWNSPTCCSGARSTCGFTWAPTTTRRPGSATGISRRPMSWSPGAMSGPSTARRRSSSRSSRRSTGASPRSKCWPSCWASPAGQAWRWCATTGVARTCRANSNRSGARRSARA